MNRTRSISYLISIVVVLATAACAGSSQGEDMGALDKTVVVNTRLSNDEVKQSLEQAEVKGDSIAHSLDALLDEHRLLLIGETYGVNDEPFLVEAMPHLAEQGLTHLALELPAEYREVFANASSVEDVLEQLPDDFPADARAFVEQEHRELIESALVNGVHIAPIDGDASEANTEDGDKAMHAHVLELLSNEDATVIAWVGAGRSDKQEPGQLAHHLVQSGQSFVSIKLESHASIKALAKNGHEAGHHYDMWTWARNHMALFARFSTFADWYQSFESEQTPLLFHTDGLTLDFLDRPKEGPSPLRRVKIKYADAWDYVMLLPSGSTLPN